MAYAGGAGSVSIGTAATLICVPSGQGVLVQNNGTAAVTLGGAGVSAGTAVATGGVTLPAGQTSPVMVPTGLRPGTVAANDGLYGRTSSGTSSVAFLSAV